MLNLLISVLGDSLERQLVFKNSNYYQQITKMMLYLEETTICKRNEIYENNIYVKLKIN